MHLQYCSSSIFFLYRPADVTFETPPSKLPEPKSTDWSSAVSSKLAETASPLFREWNHPGPVIRTKAQLGAHLDHPPRNPRPRTLRVIGSRNLALVVYRTGRSHMRSYCTCSRALHELLYRSIYTDRRYYTQGVGCCDLRESRGRIRDQKHSFGVTDTNGCFLRDAGMIVHRVFSICPFLPDNGHWLSVSCTGWKVSFACLYTSSFPLF